MCSDIFTSNYTTFHLTSKINKSMKVYLSGSPLTSSIEEYTRFMKARGVTDILCFCKLAFDTSIIVKDGINIHQLEFEDGKYPDPNIIDKFNIIINDIIQKSPLPIINMYCQAGMGRAPTMLAYLMISRFGWNNYQCLEYIRKCRKGCFNKTQLNWIIDSKIKTISFSKSPKDNKKCSIM